ncbi:MAG: hypothetical protein OXR62_09190 [Ahrensia sp.]|nr:hypothetical protein [Ahrensia sp.]
MSDALFPHPIYAAAQNLLAGDRLVLPACTFDEPLVLNGLRGSAEKPIVIEGRLKGLLPEPNAAKRAGGPDSVFQAWPLGKEAARMTCLANFGTVFGHRISECEAREQANRASKRREEGGQYPVPSWLHDQAMVMLINCRHVVLRNIAFDECWPTAIYLEDCQNIALDHIGFGGTTLCIGANGGDTKDLLIQNCRWKQSDAMFGDGEANWQRIHGSSDNNSDYMGVDVDNDFRHLDGDFFRGWNIFGNVVFRRNWVTKCFNAIHFFTNGVSSESGALDALSATNVLIEDNVFYKVRDNCIEPEDYARNWVVRHNRFDDCYAPFSLDVQRLGSLYIYGNAGVMEEKAFTSKETSNKSPRLWKLGGPQRHFAPSYVMHNSWRLKNRALAKRIFGGLRHFNNAISFKEMRDVLGKIGGGGLFGGTSRKWKKSLGDGTYQEALDATSFTRRWPDFDIVVNGDYTNDWFTEKFSGTSRSLYQHLGYDLGGLMTYSPRVFDGATEKPEKPNAEPFKLHASGLTATLVNMPVELPKWFARDEAPCMVLRPGDRPGVIQSDGNLYGEGWEFGFLPDFSYLNTVLETAPRMDSD